MKHKIAIQPIIVTLLLAGCFIHNLTAQAFYTQTFGTGTSFPGGWSSTDTRIAVNVSVPSSGYSLSSASPQASGGSNVIFQDCAPNNATLTLSCNNVINTTGKTGIRVGFGRRETSAFGNAVSFDWSSDGTSWNSINPDVSANNANSNWETASFDLPADAENVANLRFRFVFTTTTNANCTAAPNFRIDDFTVGENVTLPVSLQSFTAHISENSTLLSFSTASERNNAYFNIERSADGRGYTKIGTVKGAGDADTRQEYTFTDDKPLPGTNYYRLQQVDFDGAASYSMVRSVVFSKPGSLSLFPNPTNEWLQIQLEKTFATDAPWQIIDLAGRILDTGTLAGEQQAFQIPVNTLTEGMYCLRIVTDQQVLTQQFSKQ